MSAYDDLAWLRRRGDPRVLEFLHEGNARTETEMAEFASLVRRLDPDRHSGVETVMIKYGAQTTTFVIGRNGVIQDVTYEGEEPTGTPVTEESGSRKEE